MKKIVEIQVKIIKDRLKTKSIELNILPEVFIFLAKEGYNPQYGARPLKRLIQNKILTKIASLIISQSVAEGGFIEVGFKDNEFVFDVKKKGVRKNKNIKSNIKVSKNSEKMII